VVCKALGSPAKGQAACRHVNRFPVSHAMQARAALSYSAAASSPGAPPPRAMKLKVGYTFNTFWRSNCEEDRDCLELSTSTQCCPYALATAYPYSIATAYPYSIATAYPYSIATAYPYSIATAYLYSIATAYLYSIATSYPYSFTTAYPYSCVPAATARC
jgi:hypothetical protein